MRGDIILYESSGSLSDRIIVSATHGRFTHCEIDRGGSTIGARYDGIKVHPYFSDRGSAVIHPKASQEDIDYALAWAEKQVGREYGWLDILDNGLNLLGIQLELGRPGSWDCSDFVTRYLIEAHSSGPLGERANNPGLVSPNDLARAFGVK